MSLDRLFQDDGAVFSLLVSFLLNLNVSHFVLPVLSSRGAQLNARQTSLDHFSMPLMPGPLLYASSITFSFSVSFFFNSVF